MRDVEGRGRGDGQGRRWNRSKVLVLKLHGKRAEGSLSSLPSPIFFKVERWQL